MTSAPPPPARGTYRHGDLRRALLDAGVALARQGGPDAVVLREATRRAGVAPNAAYRHFANRQALLDAVQGAALAAAAVAIEAEIAALPTRRSPVDAARARLRAVGTGYLRFAQAETGLFRTAFAAAGDVPRPSPDPDAAGDGPRSPYALLGAALDELVACGALPAERRAGAEVLAWSAVHGLAMLVLDGPLGGAIGPRMLGVGERLLDMVERGL